MAPWPLPPRSAAGEGRGETPGSRGASSTPGPPAPPRHRGSPVRHGRAQRSAELSAPLAWRVPTGAAAEIGRHGPRGPGCRPRERSTAAGVTPALDGSSKPPRSHRVSVTFSVEGEVKPKPRRGRNPQTASAWGWRGCHPSAGRRARRVSRGPGAPSRQHPPTFRPEAFGSATPNPRLSGSCRGGGGSGWEQDACLPHVPPSKRSSWEHWVPFVSSWLKGSN